MFRGTRWGIVLSIIIGIIVAAPVYAAVPNLTTSFALLFPNSSATAANTRIKPVAFIENVGQFDKKTRFQIWSPTSRIVLAEDALTISIPNVSYANHANAVNQISGASAIKSDTLQTTQLKISFTGANAHPRLEPFDKLNTNISYFVGNNPDNWRVNVPVWSGVRYVDLYPNIDLEISGKYGQLTQRLVARPGADLAAVRLQVKGAEKLTIDRGYLRFATSYGNFSLPLLELVAPDGFIIRNRDAKPEIIGNQISNPFTVGKSSELNAQAAANSAAGASDLLYATFLGGSNPDTATDIAVDASGSAYVTGYTLSSNFPAGAGAYDSSYNGNYDVFVSKLKADGSGLDYTTFLGSGSADQSNSIAVDAAGNAYITGSTQSMDFPTTAGAYDTSFNGSLTTAFIAKLNSAGNQLLYSTYLGGGSNPSLTATEDIGRSIAVDSVGNAYITGWTQSTNFPTRGALQSTFGGGQGDAFVSKLNAAGSDLVYSSYLGGDSALNGSIGDSGYGIAVDANGAAFVTGLTISTDFPTTSGAFKTTGNGAFITKFNPAGNGLDFSTLFCACNSWGFGVAVDGLGNAYVTGYDESGQFPTTAGAFQTTFNGGLRDAFVVKMDPSGTTPIYATYLGGSQNDYGHAIAVDNMGDAYVTGYTQSPNFPVTQGAYQTAFNKYFNPYVTKLNPAGSGLIYSSFLGWTDYSGECSECIASTAVDSDSNAFVSGTTNSTDFPTTAGAFQTTFGGGEDVFVAKVAVPNTNLVVDSDGDGLPDYIEENGYDLNGEHVDLKGMGALTDRKDIFVYIDWIEKTGDHSHRPGGDSINQVIRAFDQAPVDCDTSGQNCKGINLHVVFGQKIEETEKGTNENKDLGSFIGRCDYDWKGEFDSYKTSNFPRKMWPIFHYVIFAHNLPPDPCKDPSRPIDERRPSGISRNGDSDVDFQKGTSDFVVALGPWETLISDTELATARASTLMHELGHNLGLGHGGVILDTSGNVVAADRTNYEPNHLSIMNYAFSSYRGLLKKDNSGGLHEGNVDYSRFGPDVVPDLVETELSEPGGLRAGDAASEYGTVYFCQGTNEKKVIDAQQQNVNWNCNKDQYGSDIIDANLVHTDINRDSIVSNGSTTNPPELTTVNEWQHLKYMGGFIGDFGGTVELPQTTSMDLYPELTLEEDQAIGHLLELPTANAGGPYSGAVGETVAFNGGASSDPNGTIVLYEWDFEGDGIFDFSSSDPMAFYAYPTAFSGLVSLRVTDNDGNIGTGTAQVQIRYVTANLTVFKIIVNDHGGTKTVSDFPLKVDDNLVTNGVATTVAPGPHTVSEQNLPGYTATFSGDCNASGQITVNAGENKTCTITNDDQPASITIIKDAVPDDSQDFAFSGALGAVMLDDDPGNNTLSNQATFANLASGVYGISETAANGWNVSAINCNDSDSTGDPGTRTAAVKLQLGENVTCTFTNQRQAGTVVGVCGGYTVYQTGSTYSAPGWSGTIKVGTSANNTINGTNGADLILGLGGSDKIYGKGGDDVICGGAGNDLIEGAAGNDTLDGGEGNDLLRGEQGDYDVLLGGTGNDGLFDPDGVDGIYGGIGNDLFTFALRKGWRDRTGATRFAQKLSGGYQDDVVIFAILDRSTFFVDITGDERDNPPASAEGRNDTLALVAKLDPASVITKFEHPLIQASSADIIDQVEAMEQQYARQYGFVLDELGNDGGENISETMEQHIFLPMINR